MGRNRNKVPVLDNDKHGIPTKAPTGPTPQRESEIKAKEQQHSIPVAVRASKEGISETEEEARVKEVAAQVGDEATQGQQAEATARQEQSQEQQQAQLQPTHSMAEAQESIAQAEQPATDFSDSPAHAASPAPESLFSMESILDKPPLTQLIKEALAPVDRVDKQSLCEQLGSPISEFKAAVAELVEANVVKDDAINKTLYLLLTEEERKEYQEDKATVRRDDRFKALTRIHDRRTYREDYCCWDEFLHHELCLENAHDWWETEKRTARIQQLMNAEGLKLKVPLNKSMAQHLNRVRNDSDLFVSCVCEFQALPQDRQIAKRLGEIVDRHLARQSKLSSLRQSFPDATDEEVAILAPIHATDNKWRCWYPQHTKELQERVRTSGRPGRDCILEMAQEIKALPSDSVLLGVARGGDLVPLVNDLMRLVGVWDREQKKKDEIEAWERQGQKLRIYDPASKTVINQAQPVEAKPPAPEATQEVENVDKPHEATPLYDLELTGEFAEYGDRLTLTPEKLADLLLGIADSLDDGWLISRPSSITVRPAVSQEQSA